MSMDISPLSRTMPGLPIKQTEKADAASSIERSQEKTGSAGDRQAIPRADEYLPGEPPTPSGLYHVSQGEDGSRKIMFDDPANESSGPDAPQKAKDGQDTAESCTTNTDKVDREIKKLQQKKSELEQEIARFKDDPDKRGQLEKRLAQVENELREKDTDIYRRQHSEISRVWQTTSGFSPV